MKIGIEMKEIATGVGDGAIEIVSETTEVGFPLKPLAEAIETIQKRLGEVKKMPEYGEERGRGDEREERRGDRDRDRDRDRWDVKPERPSKNTMEAAEDVEGLMKVAWDVAKDVAHEKADAILLIATYNWILAAREI
jgi:hypothetical protein